MARRAPVFAPPSGTPNLFSNPYAGQANAPVDQNQSFNALAQQYQQQYNTPGFATKHPVLTGLAGLALAGPAGAFALPVALKDKEQQKKASLLASFNQMVKDRLGNQKTVDEITQPLNQVADAQRIVNDANKLRPVDNQLSNFYPQNLPGMDGSANQARIPNLSREYVQNRLKSSLAGSDADYLQSAGLNAANRAFNLTNGLPGQVGQGEQGAFQAGANAVDTGANVPTPSYIANSEQVLNNLQQLMSTGINAGQKTYEFNQEAPKREAQIAKLLSEGRVDEARVMLLGAQANTERGKPALQKSQINQNNSSASFNNRRYGGGPPQARAISTLEAMTPAQKAKYLQRLADGPATVNANGDIESVVYGADGKVKSRTVRTKGGSGGGAVQTLSTGRKFKI